MKKFLFSLLAGTCLPVLAQTNGQMDAPTAATNSVQTTFLTSDSATMDRANRQMIYLGHVLVADPKMTLQCGQLTVNLPTVGNHPTSAIAVTNVAIDFLDAKGQTNHVTSDKAVYAYSVVNSVTNETVTWTGNPKVDFPDYTIWSEPLVWDRTADSFHFTNEKIVPKQNPAGKGTNASPLDILKLK